MNMKTIIRNVRGILNVRVVNVENTPIATDEATLARGQANEGNRIIVIPLFSAPIMFIYDEKAKVYKLA